MQELVQPLKTPTADKGNVIKSCDCAAVDRAWKAASNARGAGPGDAVIQGTTRPIRARIKKTGQVRYARVGQDTLAAAIR